MKPHIPSPGFSNDRVLANLVSSRPYPLSRCPIILSINTSVCIQRGDFWTLGLLGSSHTAAEENCVPWDVRLWSKLKNRQSGPVKSRSDGLCSLWPKTPERKTAHIFQKNLQGKKGGGDRMALWKVGHKLRANDHHRWLPETCPTLSFCRWDNWGQRKWLRPKGRRTFLLIFSPQNWNSTWIRFSIRVRVGKVIIGPASQEGGPTATMGYLLNGYSRSSPFLSQIPGRLTACDQFHLLKNISIPKPSSIYLLLQTTDSFLFHGSASTQGLVQTPQPGLLWPPVP